MPFVQRGAGGNITGLFANRQEGFAEEYLPETDAEVAAFLAQLPGSLVEHDEP